MESPLYQYLCAQAFVTVDFYRRISKYSLDHACLVSLISRTWSSQYDNARFLITVWVELMRPVHRQSSLCLIMPQSHPTMGPVRFLTPVRFLARKAGWSARRNFTPVLLSWSHQATGPLRLDTAVHLCFDQIILMIHMDPVRCPYGRRSGPAR